MDSQRDYAELAAECEKKAEQGERPTPGFWTHVPAVEDVLDDDFGCTISTLEYWTSPVATIVNEEANAEGHVVSINGNRVHAIHTTADSDDSPDELERKDALATTAAMLFAEALLRDATKPLHQGVYNELATTKDMLNTTHGQIFDMCEHLGVKREDEPCDAWALRDAIIKMEQANDDLCTALCHATDQRMSKPGYTVDAMMSEIDDVRQRAIDKAKDELEDDLETATRIAHLVLIRSDADDSDGDELLDSYRKQISAIVKSKGYVV